MTPRQGVRLCIAALAVCGAVFFLLKGSPSRKLEISDANSGKVYGVWPLEGSGEFAIEFIHSVNQSPIRETFKAEGGSIWTVAVRFYAFGAGVLSDPGEGRQMTRDGDAMVISGFDTSLRELNYIVGTVSDHLLHINGETVSLRDLCGRNAHITIRPK
jgi:hypothetical protein